MDLWKRILSTIRAAAGGKPEAHARTFEQETFSQHMERQTAQAARIAVGDYSGIEPGELEAIEAEDRSREDVFVDHTERIDLSLENGENR
jgi:hypothetical protein